MKIHSFGKERIAFQLLLLIVLSRWETITCQLNLYDTDQAINSNALYFDCLHYYIYNETFTDQELVHATDEFIPYCIRPANDFDMSSGVFNSMHGQNLSFEELRFAIITIQQFLSWSNLIDLTERYQLYLDDPNSSLNEYFYNCTEPWFGLRCQYSFLFNETMTIAQIVETEFLGKMPYSQSSELAIQLPCYVLLKCDRDDSLLCLDWREVCDGRVDCFDGGLDEKSCFEMEINECEENEYRCHNGLCIPHELWEDDLDDADCLDGSDEASSFLNKKSCFQDPTFRCEEQSCGPNWHAFPCGDGQCVPKLGKCSNGRHTLLIESMTAKGNLSDKCWIAMTCLTRVAAQVNGSLCKAWLIDNIMYDYLETCESLFQFPTIPVQSDHIRFFYYNPHSRSNVSTFPLPNFICYDQQLCDLITPTFVYENLTCLRANDMELEWTNSENDWIYIISQAELYFRRCLISHADSDNAIKFFGHPSLYKCQNSSKLISKHRILDGSEDCYLMDDENDQNSCSLNDRYRIECPGESKCWSPILTIYKCSSTGEVHEKKISFQNFCNGIEEHSIVHSNGQIGTDESECEHWPCDNLYARCDGFWACPNGQDEDNCGQTICKSGTQACISPVNYTLTCLPSYRVNDSTMDCLGASDERHICRKLYPLKKDSVRFHCWNYDLCVRSDELCNHVNDCRSGDDEGFCKAHQFICDEHSSRNQSEAENLFCGLNEKKKSVRYFSVRTSSNYPSLEKSVIRESTQQPIKQRPVANVPAPGVGNNSWPWYCNRGLTLRLWNGNNSYNRACLCPPSYYGHLCQYQNQRVSLMLRLSSLDRRSIFAVVIMLIDDNDERQMIIAHNQYVYLATQSCSIKLKRYSLFSTRPKNLSRNYSMRIDTFEKNTLTYAGSWYFSIPFVFLPVNRLSALVILSNQPVQISSSCLIICTHGQCIKYLNREKYFCRCSSGWSGVQCNIPINCQTCSSNSICVGSANNQSICVCPINKAGPRCLFKSSCPPNACENDGQCVSADFSISNGSYACVCSDRFYGPKCESKKFKLEVSLDNIIIPSYLEAYFFTLSNESEPITTTALQKLTLFQHIVTFYIPIHFHMVVVKASEKYYLVVIQQSPHLDISTSINSARECISVEQLFNDTVMKMVEYQRVKLYHILCQTRFDLLCFVDKSFFCLCTNDHHANCLDFNREKNFRCSSNHSCVNGAQCVEDHPTCPSTRICVCNGCFFGNQCQFYAKGFGSTLDEILGYEMKHNTSLFEQPLTVKVSTAITLVMCATGIINGILSILTFSRKKAKEIGCGIYLYASSITSLLIVILFTLKFSFLFASYQHHSGQSFSRYVNCLFIEPLLKLMLYMDNWLNACVATERTVSVIQGIHFDKNKSKRVAKWVIVSLPIIIVGLFIPQLLRLHLFEDKKEERAWCVVTYSPWLQTYSSNLIFVHYFAPLSINIFSAIFIIIATTRRRAVAQTDGSCFNHLRSKLKKYKHLLISPVIIVILTLPHLIITIILDCSKSSKLFWFYLIGYFLSYVPAVIVFLIFTLPSPLYKQEFIETILFIRRRLNVARMRFCRL